MMIGKLSIKPTDLYILNHSDVDWTIVIRTILSPTRTHPNKHKGKDRFTYIKKFKKYIVEIHTKNDNINGIIWVINAFQNRRN